MKIDWKKHIVLIKKAIVFILGGFVLPLGMALLLYKPLGNFLNSLSEEEIKNFANNSFYEITRNSFNIYLIAYILFGQLPQKIIKAHVLLKGLYFAIFYLFCWVVYIWI